MKKSKYLLFAGIVCLMATACQKDKDSLVDITLDKFVMGDTQFKSNDNSKVALKFSSNKLVYEDGDVIKVNGETYTLSKSGTGSSTVWYANGPEITGSQFYCAYVDGVSDNDVLSGYSGNTYQFNISNRLTSATNKVLLGGVTENNVLTLYPACAIIRLDANNTFSNVKIGFESNKVLKAGIMSIAGDGVTLSGNTFMRGVDLNGEGADFLSMEYSSEGYWYVAVPVSANVSTKLYFYWEQGGSPVGRETSGQVTLQKGYVYSVGSSTQSPFNVDGTSKCKFKVSDERGQYVNFSPGNLQAKFVTSTDWRFAPEQTTYIGASNLSTIDADGQWYDLFGYGTSDWSGGGATAYRSYSNSKTATHYIQNSLTGSYANADWGVYNGTNIKYGDVSSGTTWRTLTGDEWNYLLNRSGLGALATVKGQSGIILLPDIKANNSPWVYDTELPSGPTFNAGYSGGYSANVYDASDWNKLEAAGAIFLPAAGYRNGSNNNSGTYTYSSYGRYWSSTYVGDNPFARNAKALKFSASGANVNATDMAINYGFSVRLVHPLF